MMIAKIRPRHAAVMPKSEEPNAPPTSRSENQNEMIWTANPEINGRPIMIAVALRNSTTKRTAIFDTPQRRPLWLISWCSTHGLSLHVPGDNPQQDIEAN